MPPIALKCIATGYHANDAYTAYIEMGSPKELTAAQIAHLNDLTRDLPETDKSRCAADRLARLSSHFR